jgi:DNA-binding response OmpR family regulator
MAKKKIMIVDDEKDLLIMLKEVFGSEGFEVITAESGKECLEKLKTIKPDLIIMDMMMPKLSGDEVIKKIRKNPKTKDLRIVILTVSKIAEIPKVQLNKLKVLEYINKPFDLKELTEKIKKVV